MCAPMFIASKPDEHCLLIATVGISSGIPARRADNLAAYPASADCIAFPIITSSMRAGAILALSRAVFIAMAPSFGADISLKDPPNLPTGVRAPLTIKASFIL